MASTDRWQSAFVATTVALGDSIADALSSLGPDDADAASATTRALGHGEKQSRARGLAAVLGRIVADLELGRLA